MSDQGEQIADDFLTEQADADYLENICECDFVDGVWTYSGIAGAAYKVVKFIG